MNFTYFDLDCTLEILNLYVTCIPQLVIKNISLPLGFIAGVEESLELYKLQHILGRINRLHELLVQSDHAPGLVKFCKDINILQFFCIRHIINSIGPMSFFGKLAMKLLMSQSEPQFVANYQ